MKSNGIDIGLSSGLTNPYSFVGNANGMQNSEQMESDVNTFISTWKTNAVTATVKTINLPLVSTGSYNFWVDWGDGNKDFIKTYNQANSTHTYAIAGTYTIKIKGECTGFDFVGAGDVAKLISIDRWGCLMLVDNATKPSGFNSCINLKSLSTVDTLKMPSTFSTFMTFANDTQLSEFGAIGQWDMSNITDIGYCFSGCTLFNHPINSWNTSKVSSMIYAFSGISFNQPLNLWNTSNVTNMTSLFASCTAFNQDISSWDVSKVTSMPSLFQNATAFSQPLSNWERSTVGDTSTLGNVTNMSTMFRAANSFNQDISNWNVSKVTNMSSMFILNTLYNQPLNSWNVGAVTNMSSMFESNTAFNQPLNLWNTGAVTNMSLMFNNATAFNQNIGSWNVSNVSSTGFINFMGGKTPATFSAANLDAIYSGWSSRTSASNASISFGTANYTTAGGGAGRAILVSRGWTIVDGGGI